jgi:hypothetical protein
LGRRQRIGEPVQRAVQVGQAAQRERELRGITGIALDGLERLLVRRLGIRGEAAAAVRSSQIP